jgi:hypothetical protein
LQLAFIAEPLVRDGVLGNANATAVIPRMAAITVDHEGVEVSSSTEATIHFFLRLEFGRTHAVW